MNEVRMSVLGMWRPYVQIGRTILAHGVGGGNQIPPAAGRVDGAEGSLGACMQGL